MAAPVLSRFRAPAAAAAVGLFALLSCMSLSAHAQAAYDDIIERYVAEGLRSNLALRSETLEVEKATHALAEARAGFFPELSLQARYTRAEGGRDIDIPIGSALNPVYSTLNEMLEAQGQPAQFPQIQDQTVPFLREKEQDTRL
jgi:outer membrane protein TolC